MGLSCYFSEIEPRRENWPDQYKPAPSTLTLKKVAEHYKLKDQDISLEYIPWGDQAILLYRPEYGDIRHIAPPIYRLDRLSETLNLIDTASQKQGQDQFFDIRTLGKWALISSELVRRQALVIDLDAKGAPLKLKSEQSAYFYPLQEGPF